MEAFTADKLREHHSVPALSKTSRERVMGHLSGRAEGIQGIPRIEHRMYRGQRHAWSDQSS